VDPRAEIRDFLTSRRARITPQQAGLPDYGGKRRVPGLRRSELATLAGISVEYLTQLERGNVAGASESVLDALARALQLDEAERTHLFDLARAATGPRRSAGRGRAARGPACSGSSVAALRIQVGRTPSDRQLTDLVGELATRSDAFATRWGKHNVRLHRTATKRLRNTLVGELKLTADALELPGEDVTLIVYTAPAGSPEQEKLDFLSRWAGGVPPAGTADLSTEPAPKT
jgi:transcriptional regulator with XRE-family HTH domain